MVDVADRWAAGSTYEDFMGRWSRRLAPKFVKWLGVASELHWLDVGCGTGALTGAIVICAEPASVVACDPSQSFIEYAQKNTGNEHVSFVMAGVDSLPDPSGGFDSVTSSLALNFFPDPSGAVGKMRAASTRGGTVSSCVWDYSGRMEFLRIFWDAASRVDPNAIVLDEGTRFPLCRRDALVDLFRNAGLRDIRCEPVEIGTDFSSFEEYWRSFQGGSGPAPSYVASLEEDQRAELANELERALPTGADGSIRLTARAWAVRGTS
jgi:SAM-dependent methyltransferase